MLRGLTISNYILIDSLDVSFPEGLVIISGETGAGKSILLGALSLVLGAKADNSAIGPHGDSCVVEACFDTAGNEALQAFLKENDLPCEPVLELRRTLSRSGRSRCFVNDEPVAVAQLQELGSMLVDIHSQHQSLQLASESFRMQLLDLYSGAMDLRRECARAWRKLQEATSALEQFKSQREQARREAEFNQAAFERLDAAKLISGELEQLEGELKQLEHADQIKEALQAALLPFDPPGEAVSLTRSLREVQRQTEKSAAFLPKLEGLAGRLESARLELEDIAAELESAESSVEVSPERLEWVQERLSLLYTLMQRHGASTVEELIAERDRLGVLLEAEADAPEQLRALEKAQQEALKQHSALCKELHDKRAAALESFSDTVQKQLRELELEHAVFCVQLTPVSAGANGSDAVEFMFSSTGKNLQSVSKAASGGELSRLMLSLKAMMARYTAMPTLLFDEIDSGVSGSAADKMGSLICRMGRDMQVFAITHLPQVAAKGQAHYLVSKSDDVTSISLLQPDQRLREIARMLSGSSITPEALANAKRVLSDAAND
ncbi:MAG: DNA repair protein RecN [Bacteroidales bacterium]|nr:DNA repair protein RecN [Bacteroidales bacterium]